MSTTPDGPGGPDAPDLPPMAPHITVSFAEPSPEPDWSDRDAVIETFVEGARLFSGSIPVDEARTREFAGRMFDRTTDIAASQTNHWIIEGSDSVRSRLSDLNAPTLVLHGTDDPLFPIGHAEALTREIPGARLLPLPGVGHEIPPPQTWDAFVEAILDHTSGRR